MLTKKQMLEQVSDYILSIQEGSKTVYLAKGRGAWVVITPERAIEWVKVGIDELDCLDAEEMLEILNSWINEKE